MFSKFTKSILIFMLAAGLLGCGEVGGYFGSVAGSVMAPGGTVAFNAPTTWYARLWRLLVPEAVAVGGGSFSSVGAGVAVRLVGVDADNNATEVYGTGITVAGGTFTLDLNRPVTPGLNYAVQAMSGNTVLLQAAYTANTDITIDPVSTVVHSLVLDQAKNNSVNVSTLSVNTVPQIYSSLNHELVGNKYDSSANTVTNSINSLRTVATKVEEISNQIASSSASGKLDGIVTDPNGNPLPGILVGIVDYGNWVLRASTTTDKNGYYDLRAPTDKDYIVAVKNMSDSLPYASGWRLSSGETTVNPFNGSKIALTSSSQTANITLRAGKKLSGKVYDSTGLLPLRGIRMKISDAISGSYLMQLSTKVDGSYQVWLPAAKYIVSASNITSQPYGSGWYNNSGSMKTNVNEASQIDLSTDSSIINMSLPAGVLVSGYIASNTTRAAGGTYQNLLTGIPVRIYNGDPYSDSYGAFVEAVRSDGDGYYSIMLPAKNDSSAADVAGSSQPAGTISYPFYTLKSKGMTRIISIAQSDVDSSANKTQDFAEEVITVSGYVKDQSGNAIGNAKIILFSYADPNSSAVASVTSGQTTLKAGFPTSLSSSNPSDRPYTASGVNSKSSYGFECSIENLNYGSVPSPSYNNNQYNTCMSSLEVSNSDGSFTVWMEKPNGSQKAILQAVIDDDRLIASSYYKSASSGVKRPMDATLIDLSSAGASKTISGIDFRTRDGSADTVGPASSTVTLVKGRVVDPSGNPLPNIKLNFRPVTNVAGDNTSTSSPNLYSDAICSAKGNTKSDISIRTCGQHAHSYVFATTDANGEYSISMHPGTYIIRMQTSNSGYFSNTFRYSWVASDGASGYISGTKMNLCSGSCNASSFIPTSIPVNSNQTTVNIRFNASNMFN